MKVSILNLNPNFKPAVPSPFRFTHLGQIYMLSHENNTNSHLCCQNHGPNLSSITPFPDNKTTGRTKV